MTDPAPGVHGAEVEFRQPGTWFLVALYAFLVASWLLGSVLPGAGPHGAVLLWQGAFVVLMVVAAVLQWRARIRIGADGVDARDQFGRRRGLAWAEVHHFERRGYWGGLGAWTVDGRWVRLMQYGAYERRAADYLVHLETYRWERQQALGLA